MPAYSNQKMYKILLIFISLFTIGCYQTERNCSHFKTGKFKTELTVNNQKQTVIFERTENLEITFGTPKNDTASLRWLNDCEYIVQQLHPKNKAEEKAVHIKILTTNPDSYSFEFSLVGNPKKQKSIAYKIN